MLKKLTLIILICAVICATACASGNIIISETPGTEPEEIAVPATQPEETPGQIPETDTQSASKSAYKKYLEIMEITNSGFDLNNVQVDMDISIDMITEITVFGETTTGNMNMNGNLKLIADDESTQYGSVMYMTDSSLPRGYYMIEMYFDGEDSYYAVGGHQIELTEDAFLEELNNAADIPEISEQAILSANTVSSGGYDVSEVLVDGKELTGYLLEEAAIELDDFGVNADISIDDVKIKIVNLSDGTPVSLEMAMDMIISSGKLETKISMVLEYVIISYGSGVEIDFPGDMG